MPDHEPPDIGVIGEQDDLPKGAVPAVKEPGVLEKKVVEPAAKGAKKVGAGIKKGVPWVAGIGGLAGLGILIKWLGWGEGGSGIFEGKGPLRKDFEAVDKTDKTSDEIDATELSDLQAIYQREGFNSPLLGNENLGEPELTDSNQFIALTAEAGGASWMVPVKKVGDKAQLPDNIDVVADGLAEQLPGVTATELKDNWINWHEHPDQFLAFLSSHGASPEVVAFLQYGYDIAHDNTPETWQEREEMLKQWEYQSSVTPTLHSSEEGHGKSGLAVPAEQEYDSALEIAARIFAESLKVEGAAIQPLIKPAMEIAQDLVVNHRLSEKDDVQELLGLAIEGGDSIADYVKDLAADARQAIEARINHRVKIAQQAQTDHIFENPADAINYVTSGGGIPMLIILGIECGLAAINSALYIKRAKETRNIPLPTPEEIRRKAVEEWLDYEKNELDRRMPDGFVPAGKITQSNIAGVTIGNVAGKGQEDGRRVVGQVIIEAEKIKDNGQDYIRLVDVLKKGVRSAAWDELEQRGLFIPQKDSQAAPFVKASDLMWVIQEMRAQNQYKGELLPGEPDWYD